MASGQDFAVRLTLVCLRAGVNQELVICGGLGGIQGLLPFSTRCGVMSRGTNRVTPTRVSTAFIMTSASSSTRCRCALRAIDKRESPMAHIHPVIMHEAPTTREHDDTGQQHSSPAVASLRHAAASCADTRPKRYSPAAACALLRGVPLSSICRPSRRLFCVHRPSRT